MTDQLCDEREDERREQEAACGETEREEEGKPYSREHDEPDEEELPDF